LIAEQRALVARAEGILARSLGEALPEESREELERIAEEDQRLAKEGLVELIDEAGETYHKHIDVLDEWDVADRLRAEIALSNRLARRKYKRINWAEAQQHERRRPKD
jgi:hypothetical protein